jgi:hypothetical protein
MSEKHVRFEMGFVKAGAFIKGKHDDDDDYMSFHALLRNEAIDMDIGTRYCSASTGEYCTSLRHSQVTMVMKATTHTWQRSIVFVITTKAEAANSRMARVDSMLLTNLECLLCSRLPSSMTISSSRISFHRVYHRKRGLSHLSFEFLVYTALFRLKAHGSPITLGASHYNISTFGANGLRSRPGTPPFKH